MRVCRKCRSVYGPGSKFCGIDGVELVEFDGDPLLGQRVDRYEVKSLLGRGASASVYKAIHTELRSPIALKVLHGQLGSDAHYVQRFRREAQVVSRIRNPNVVSVLDFGTDQGLAYLAMEFCTGTTLDRVISREKPLPPERAARIAAQVANGLDAAHQMGFVHRDVKPGNIAIEQEAGKDVAKLLDFGIVRMPELEDSDKLTQQGMVVGTPSYMAPEQTQGLEVSAQTDLYALGVVLYEMLAGNKPFTGTAAELFHQHRHRPPPSFTGPEPLVQLTLHLLQKDPATRPESAAWVAEQAKRIEVELRGGAISSEMMQPSSSSGDLSVRAPSLLATPEAATSFTTGEGQLSQARSRWAIMALVLGILGISGGLVAIGSAPTVEVQNVQVPPTPSLASLEKGLSEALEGRGLTVADLNFVPTAQGAWTRLQEARGRGDESAIRTALLVLTESIKQLPLTSQLLNDKLDRLDPLVAAAQGRLNGPDFEQLKADYLDLYRQVHSTGQPGLEAVARSIRAFEHRAAATPVAPPGG